MAIERSHSGRRGWKVRLATGFVAVVNFVWLAITTSITVANLPSDAGEAWKAVVGTPEYIPGILAGISVAILVWSLWPKAVTDTKPLISEPPPSDPHAMLRSGIERARLETEMADVVASLEFRRGLDAYVRGEPRAPPPLAHIGTLGAAAFGIDTPETYVAIDLKNFGTGLAKDVTWKALTGWFPNQPVDPVPYEIEGGIGVTEPGHSQHIKLILKSPLTTRHIQRIVRGGEGFYVLAQIDYADARGRRTRRIAYYLDPQGERLSDRWMLSVCPSGNDEIPAGEAHDLRRASRPATDEWMPLHEALRYLVYESEWGARQPSVNDPKGFDDLVMPEVRERLARGEIVSRGKLGLEEKSLSRGTEPIPMQVWVDAFIQPHGEIALSDPDRCILSKEGGGGPCYRGVILRRQDVERVWPARRGGGPTRLSLAVESLRSRIKAEKGTLGNLHDPTLVFVSTGGTCRDPMAKIIMESLVAGRDPPIRILATALKAPSNKRASKAARYIVRDEMGVDLLRDHRPTLLDESIVSEADLILTMSEHHALEIQKNFPEHRSRVHSLLGFIGQPGDVDDPWRGPDEMDAETLSRYQTCYRRLREILTKNVDTIYSAVIA